MQKVKAGSGRGPTGVLGEEEYAENYGIPNQLKTWYKLQDYDRENYVVNKVVGYSLVNYQKAIAATGAQLYALRILSSFGIPADEMAAAKIEVDLRDIEKGKIAMVQWQGVPVFVFHRDDSQIAQARSGDTAELRHAQTDEERRQGSEEWLVVVGICTHLGCIPVTEKGDFGAFFCPCHGSHYDTSGRIRLGPAPLNLEVPKHKFADDNTLVIG